MSNPRYPFRLNVGFILHEEVGYAYQYEFDLPKARLGDDLEVRGFEGVLSVGRTAQGLLFTGDFKGDTDLGCVRCLRTFEHSLVWTMTELYASNANSASESELVIPEDAQIDLQPLLREYAFLEIPIKPVCRTDCKGLCPVCGQDLNDRDCGHRPDAGPSSFAALKDLLKE